MESSEVMAIGAEVIWLFIKMALPVLLVALGVGLFISIIQALTQIQEATISFVPKLFAVLMSLIFLLPYIGNNLFTLSQRMAEKMAGM